MRVYTVHLRRHGLNPDRDLVLVKEGFCWPACFFSLFWALWLGLWAVALILLAAEVALTVGLPLIGADTTVQAIISIALAAVVGMLANDLRRWTLRRRSFVPQGVVLGNDRWSAERRFLDERPDVVRAMAS